MGVTHETLWTFWYVWMIVGGLLMWDPMEGIAKRIFRDRCLIYTGLPKILIESGVNFSEVL